MQINESTDRISSKVQLIGFGKFVDNSNIVEQFLFYKQFKSTTTRKKIFEVLNNLVEKSGLLWCVHRWSLKYHIKFVSFNKNSILYNI